MDLDTFATAVYTIVDDLLISSGDAQPGSQRRSRGRPPYLTNSETIALVLLAQWHGRGSERSVLHFAKQHWTSFFPRISRVTQSAFNQRVRKLESLLCSIGPDVASQVIALSGACPYEAVDTTAVPLMSRRRGERTHLFKPGEEAAIGRGGSDRNWYYGVKLCISVAPQGCITGFLAGPANTADLWTAEGLLRWRTNRAAGQPSPEELAAVLGPSHRTKGTRTGPTGPLWPVEGTGEQSTDIYLADRGFAGKAWGQHWEHDYGSVVLTPNSDTCPADLNSRRQLVETAFGLLIDRLNLRNLRARSIAGVRTRIAAKIAALNIGILINYLFGYPFLTYFSPA